MRQPTFFDVDQARSKGHDAAEMAASRADRVSPGWTDAACTAVARFAARHQAAWLLEEARTYAEAEGLAPPPDKRAWGAVIQILRRRGVVKLVGYGAAVSSNGSPKCRWCSAR